MLDLVLIRAHGRDDGLRGLPYGLLSIAAYLQKHGFSVEIIDRMKDYQPIAKCVRLIKEMSPRIIGIGAMSSQSKDAISLGRRLKEALPAKIIYGGQHFTALPGDGLKYGDAVIRNDGEEVLLELCRMGTENIKGIFEGKPISNLDDIPLPSDEMLKSLFQGGCDPFSILTSRGCYFKCLFCKNRDYDCKVRYHSIEYICDYLEKVVRLFRVEYFFIVDDVFTSNKERVIRFCDEVKKRGLKLKFKCFTHANVDDLEMYKIMKDAGFRYISIGVESSNDMVLKALHKHQTVQDCMRTIEVITEAGLNPIALFMIGNITETEETIRDTIELAGRLRQIRCGGWFSYAQPFPGSEFYDVAEKYGELVNRDPSTYWTNSISFIPDGLTKSKMKRMGAILAKTLGYSSLIERIKSGLMRFFA